MPEGDTIHYAAARIRPLLEGRVPDAIATPHPRFGADRWPQRLAGKTVSAVHAHGKHLFLRFDEDLTLHSHLRMSGSWDIYREGERWRRGAHRAWLTIRAQDHVVVQFDGPVLELLTEPRRRLDLRLNALGPDILAPALDTARILQRLRGDDPTRAFGDALLDQRTVAGIGNIWKCEGCWDAELDPWRRSGEVADDDVAKLLQATRARMQDSAAGGNQRRERHVYRRAGRPCLRCGAPIQVRGQGDANRATYWCQRCQT
jgi:endonuclease-8